MPAEFDAFISYSRRASSTLAVDLQSSVERFAKPWYALRAVRVFRDDASMSANVALWSAIEQALSQAEWFVLLASPAAAQSVYVAKEVEWWREHKGAERILIVLEEGTDIAWDASANDFDWERTDSLPRALSHAYAEEPRWIDLRWFELEGSLKRTDPRWPERVADVAAAVRFAERDQLIGENVREHRRLRRLQRVAVTALSLLVVASLVATVVAVRQRSEAQRQATIAVEQREVATAQARIALARQLSAQALSLAATDLRTASLLAVQGFRTHDDAQTKAALFQVATASPELVRPLPAGARVLTSAVTPDGVAVTGDADGRVLRWDGPEPTEVATLPDRVLSVSVSDDGSTVAATDESGVLLWRDGQAVMLPDLAQPAYVELDPAGTYLAATDNFRRTAVWSLDSAAPAYRGTVRASGDGLTFGDLGLTMYGTTKAAWYVVDPSEPRILGRGTHAVPMGSATAVSGDGRTFAAFAGGVDVTVWTQEAAFADTDEGNAVGHTDLASGQALALSADGSLVATQGDGRVEVAAVQRPDETARRPLVLDGAGDLAPGNGGALAFGGDRYLLSATGETALLWDLAQLNRFGSSVEAPVPVGCGACGPGRMTLSPDGSRALIWAIGDFDDGPVVVDLGSGETARLDAGGFEGFEALAWDGTDRVVGYRSSDASIVSLAADGTDVTVLGTVPVDSDAEAVVDLVVDSGVARLVTRGGAVFAVDLASGDVSSSDALAQDERAAAGFFWRFAPDGSSLYVLAPDDSGDGVVLVLDVDSDRLAFTGPATAAAYDAASRLHVFDGGTVATLADGELTDRRQAPGVAAVPAPVLSPDGSIVVTGGDVTDVSLLDLDRQGARFGTVSVPHEDDAYPDSAFTPDGLTLVTALPAMQSLGLTSTLRTLSLDPADWIRAACAVAARDLTTDDWERFGVGAVPEDLRCEQ